jgi:GntR family transcriptional repressor for pyruvate dehydrogenase complex
MSEEARVVDWTTLSLAHGSVPERLGQELLRMIRQGDLADGARIPGERELSELAGVSRTSVREALRDLELQGLISRRPGRGTVVTSRDHAVLGSDLLGTMEPSERVLREVMDLRAVIEPPIAERAAARARPAEITELSLLVEEAERQQTSPVPATERLVELDVAFHVAIARLTHNPMLVRLLEVANEWMAPSRSAGLQTSRRLQRSVAAHRLVLGAIEDRDPARAHLAMARHLEEVSEAIADGQVR